MSLKERYQVNNFFQHRKRGEGAGETVMGVSYSGGDAAQDEESIEQGELRKQRLNMPSKVGKGIFHCKEEPLIWKTSGGGGHP